MMSLMTCSSLVADRIYLVPVSPADAQDLFDLWTCSEVQKLGGFNPPSDLDSVIEVLAYFKKLGDTGFFLKWIIREKRTNEFLGECELYPLKPQVRPWLEWGVGYSLKRDAWGKGFMNEAVQRMLELAFGELNAVRVKADVMLPNEKSFRLLERVGFEAEGVQSCKGLISGTFQDMALMATTKSRYLSKKKAI